MELNEPHTEHEHASLNLKVLLLIFAVILIAALGYFVWQQNHSAADSQDEAQLHPKKTTSTTTTTASDPTADWKAAILTSTIQGNSLTFSLKYPMDWTVTQGSSSGSGETGSFVPSRVSTSLKSTADNPTASGEFDLTFDAATADSITGDAARAATKLAQVNMTIDGKAFTKTTYGTSTYTKEIVYIPLDKTLPFTVILTSLPMADNAIYVTNYDLLVKSIKFIK